MAAFHAAWHEDPLVLDKWFAIQAMSKLPDTLEAVRALTRHADYDLRNPNRVRALVGSFAAGNPVRFHDLRAAGIDSLPIRSSRWIRRMVRWRRGWSRRWGSGGV